MVTFSVMYENVHITLDSTNRSSQYPFYCAYLVLTQFLHRFPVQTRFLSIEAGLSRNWATSRWTDDPIVAQSGVGQYRGRGVGWGCRVGASGRTQQEHGDHKVDREGGAGLVAVT